MRGPASRLAPLASFALTIAILGAPASAIAAAAATPELIVQQDALALPAPALPKQMLEPDNPIALEARIMPNLRNLSGGTVKVVVTLFAPDQVQVIPRDRGEVDSPARLSWIRAAAQAFVARTRPLGFVPQRGLTHLPVVIGTLPLARLRDIAADPLVRAIRFDEPSFAQRSGGAALMRSRELLAQAGSGSGIGVAIFDTGIDDTHAELAGKVTARAIYTGEAAGDRQGHGTACAGIVAGATGGMAPAAHLWDMKVLDDQGSGESSMQVSAFNDALANVSAFGGLHIISMSLGGASPLGTCDSQQPDVAAGMQSLINAGVTIFVASGNEGCTTGVGAPACISLAIAVGAVYDDNVGDRSFGASDPCSPAGCSDATSQADQITCYSNSGDELDLLAPSDCSTTTRCAAQGGGLDECFNGTSAATPYAAGVAAQLKSKVRSATPAQIRQAMMASGRPILDSRNGLTRNRVDAVAALAALGGGGGGGGDKNNIYIVPASAHFAGAAFFQTDLRVKNRSAASTASVDIYLLSGLDNAAAAPVSISIAPGQVAAYNDAVLTLLGLSAGFGALRFASDQPLYITSDTYASDPLNSAAGTYGQFIPGVAVAAGGTAQTILHIVHNGGFRSNVGVVATTAAGAQVTITYKNGDGSVIKQDLVTLGAYGWKQFNSTLGALGAQVTDNAYAEVTATGPVLSYASVVDNRTADPIFVSGEN